MVVQNTIYYPLPKKFKPNTTRNDFIDLTDILPTILDITDIKYPGENKLPGESILKEKGIKNRNYQYIENGNKSNRWISLRDNRYKYNYYYGGGYEELFDMEKDPHETINLLLTEIQMELLG